VSDGFEFVEGNCEQVIENIEVVENNGGEVPQISLRKISDLELQVLFDQGFFSFEENQEFFISFQNLKRSDFELSLSSPDQYTVNIQFTFNTLTKYNGIMTLQNSKNTQAPNQKKYPSKKFQQNFFFNKAKVMFLNQKSQNITKSSTHVLSEYGPILTAATPALVAILIPFQLIYLVALFPFKFPANFLSVLRLFVTFEDHDFSKFVLSDQFYDDDKIDSKIFMMENSIFKFSSIYQRCRGGRMFLRFVFSLVFFVLRFKMKGKKIINENCEEKWEIYKGKLVKLLVSVLISFNHINFTLDFIYICSSFATQASPSEYLFMTVDMLNFTAFQYYINKIHKKILNKNQKENEDYLERPIIEELCCFQNRQKIKIPISTILNLTNAIKILTLFSLKAYPICFSVVYSFSTVAILAFFFKKLKGQYLACVDIICFSGIFESLLSLGLCLLGFFPKMVLSGVYGALLSVLLVCWVLCSIVTSIVQFIELRAIKKRKQEVKRVEKKIGKFRKHREGMDSERRKINSVRPKVAKPQFAAKVKSKTRRLFGSWRNVGKGRPKTYKVSRNELMSRKSRIGNSRFDKAKNKIREKLVRRNVKGVKSFIDLARNSKKLGDGPGKGKTLNVLN
jgi:hypothetical protein